MRSRANHDCFGSVVTICYKLNTYHIVFLQPLVIWIDMNNKVPFTMSERLFIL